MRRLSRPGLSTPRIRADGPGKGVRANLWAVLDASDGSAISVVRRRSLTDDRQFRFGVRLQEPQGNWRSRLRCRRQLRGSRRPDNFRARTMDFLADPSLAAYHRCHVMLIGKEKLAKAFGP
jgi:hypothetical protein